MAKASTTNLVTNGSFEAGGSQRLLVGVGSDAISGWEVTQDNVHQWTRAWNSLGSTPIDISPTFNSIDLDGGTGSVGAIAQTIGKTLFDTNIQLFSATPIRFLPQISFTLSTLAFSTRWQSLFTGSLITFNC